ncbi:mannitol dehydrogenase family protein [Xinfangfangia sp. D13-10-4-6]|uniref:mannitol dehydrogenase family protein n=1 Tax=Pseudogemmobacter hezensis TaxID=2737662 RepID=UPI0015565456|nr:mannitol dehydrogenase family protein [Pseudogemmobacter hezensis]NPD16053.1 mannitol dehydrogenase family protein [Pseudogemmobacter hezensis]
MPRLSLATLNDLPPGVTRPAYNRAEVTPGIVHLGVGAFHRAHQAVFIDDCLGRGELGYGIIAASLRSPVTRDLLAPQDGLYTYCERYGTREDLRVIGSIIEMITAPENPERLIEALSLPTVRIVTLTVTEKGYLTHPASRRLLEDHPDILHDLANPDRPRTIYGFLTAALWNRRAAGLTPLTLLSCDNLPANGRVLKAALVRFAALSDPDLVTWIEANSAAPCVMVDRIVPATTDQDRATISAALGATDAWPVVAEPYFRWVIEDDFPWGRPALELSGAEIVADVEPYEHMKLRMLNGAHTAIAAAGQIAGFASVAEAFANPALRAFIDIYWREAATTLQPGMDGARYVEGLRDRFANPALQHLCVQIASDASQKVPQRLLAMLGERLARGERSDALVMAVALWIRSCGAVNEAGQPIIINDPTFNAWNAPDQAAQTPEETVAAFLGFEPVFGPTPDPALQPLLTAALTAIRDKGVIGALAGIRADS